MLQIRIHGRGGQGVVTAAPVVAFCRIDDREIRLREPILAPDVLIVQDPTLLHQVDVFQGLQPEGYVLINSTRSFDELGLEAISRRFLRERLITVPASEIALRHLGRPLPNAVLLGGFAALSGLVTLQAVAHAIRDKFSGKVAEGNVVAATEAFAYVQQELKELAHAQAD
jgi:pyruvate ferredoxin oxidoreductase gamma subunit